LAAGAQFVRVDLHVHTRPDSGVASAGPVDYVNAAIAAGLSVMAVTDHNSIDSVTPVMEAASGTALYVVPGIEITSHEGHLLALFSPEALETLREFASQSHLQLEPDPRDGSVRSTRSMIDLVGDIDSRGGLAIPAHVDAKDGINQVMSSTALAQLLAHRGLAALEFARRESLVEWFTAGDEDTARREAWRTRQAVPDLAERGLARVMSSDAHSPEKVGGDRPSRTMTRLRLDEPTVRRDQERSQVQSEGTLQGRGGSAGGLPARPVSVFHRRIPRRRDGRSVGEPELLHRRAWFGKVNGADRDPSRTGR